MHTTHNFIGIAQITLQIAEKNKIIKSEKQLQMWVAGFP